VVLEGALLLSRESPLDAGWRDRIARWDGTETTVVAPAGRELGVRVFAPPGSETLSRLREAATQGGVAWREAQRALVGWGEGRCVPLGQDAALAGRLARLGVTTGGIVQLFARSITEGITAARAARPLAEGSPLAQALGSRYPILQGPMTRVSDVAAFADKVAEGGALPFLALALLRAPEARTLLRDTSARLGDRPWGVGILGFVPPALRAEQLEVVREVRPPFALIAGGRPDQAAGLERAGIATFLHVPSPGLLQQYLKDGSRHFVLEGRECGGHVGPRSSFILWEQAADVVAEALDGGLPGNQVNLVFAGGIHDARSAALVAALAGPLAERGVRVGVLLGTAYLFTREAVTAGAIVERFQQEALRCAETVLLESGPGHHVRVSRTPFVDRFEQERKRLTARGIPADEMREALEALNVGRLRVATKGLDKSDGAESPLVPVSTEHQEMHGMYMLGQVAALRSQTTTITQLHEEICAGGTALLEQAAQLEEAPAARAAAPSDVAIIGMAAVFPGAANVSRFWSNTLRGVDSIIEVPADRWDWRLYYDPDPKAPDKIVSKWGGFLPDIAFDPLVFGMPPSTLPSIEPAQLLALEVVRTALADAGYAERTFPRERTSVVLGMGGGAAQVAMGYAFRSYLPMLDTVLPAGGKEAIEACRGLLPEWTEDSFPGFLLNVTAGRIANRLNLGGANYTVDAACGSSLAAAALAVRELETGAADLVVLGGVDTVQNPFTYLAFSKTQAFSRRGRCRPFDVGADGIVISEGVASLVLKRLADAERDGDRIYAVIKGVGCSSDGRARGLTAPVVEGQVRALERAYAKAGVSPSSVGYIEAHGTGTALGDEVEVQALGALFKEAGAARGQCVIGSVKSLVGHTKCAAGLAGLINATLSLHHKVLPPTIGIETPNPKLDLRDGPFRLCPEAQPWIHPAENRPRRSGVSAFGFGGTNFHAVLEAYERNLSADTSAALRDWPCELFVWQSPEPRTLVDQLDGLMAALERGARPHLADLAAAIESARERIRQQHGAPATLAIVAESHADLLAKLKQARAAIAEGRARFEDPRGVVYAASPAWAAQPVAFIFPGQGAQTPAMLRELAVAFEEVRAAFEGFDRVLLDAGEEPIGPLVFAQPAFDEAARHAARRALLPTDVAQPAVGAACLGMLRLMQSLGCKPDMTAGHSFGELVALHAAGALTARGLAELALLRGRAMQEAGSGSAGAMAAFHAGPDATAQLIALDPDVRIANWNGPRQTVVAGPAAVVEDLLDLGETRGISGRLLPVSCAFHTPQVAEASEPVSRHAARLIAQAPRLPVYSNIDAKPHPADTAAIAARLGQHLASPVRFAEMIEAMYEAGARVFLEVGPGSVLAPLVGGILGDRPHLALSCDAAGSSGLPLWLRTLARLTVAGVPVQLGRLTQGRCLRVLDLDQLPADDRAEPTTASSWLVNGSRARPLAGPEPKRLGTARALPGIEIAAQQSASPVAALQARPLTATDAGSPTAETGRVPQGRRAARPASAQAHPAARHPERSGPDTIMQPPNSPPPGADRVIETFQQTMQTFLEVQKTTMLAYLAGRGSPGAIEPPLARTGPVAGRSAQTEPHPADRSIPANNGERGPRPATLRLAEGTAARQPPAGGVPGVPPDPAGDPQSNGVSHELRDPSGASAWKVRETANGVVPRDEVTPPDRHAITERLLEIVRDRTGYPLETLGLDLDMEADLGIDSIKRVEILGKLRDEFPSFKGMSESAETMDALTRAHTLGAIVDRLTALAEAAPRPASSLLARGHENADLKTPSAARTASLIGALEARRVLAEPGSNGEARLSDLRRLVEVVEAPLPPGQAGLPHGSVVVISDDGRGVAARLAARLEAEGYAAELIGAGESVIDWTSPAAIGEALARARRRGPLTGIVHALPLAHHDAEIWEEQTWSARLAHEVRGLFLLARASASDLEEAARAGGACLIGATALGGRFASAGGRDVEFFAGQGGVAGLIKTLAREWPAVRCRVVDSAPGEAAEVVAGRLAAEVFAPDGWPEVGYEGGRRIRLRTVSRPLHAGASKLELAPGAPVLITGGARGITALVARQLAATWRPTLLILGTTPAPEAAESAETAGIEGEAEIKSALHAALRARAGIAGPAEIEAAYQALRRVREVRENLALLSATGARVAYAQVDVRDPAALRVVLEGWRGRFGDPVGLVHGAGLIRDKLIRQKTLESFDQVLSTKLDGALNVIRLLRPEALKFTVLFSSIAGRFGNVGQTDYAAANEVLSKLAQWLDRRWPGRVLSMIWGPWSGVGMVSQLEDHLGKRGLGLIAPDVGRGLLVEELRHGEKGDVEVLYSGGLGTLEEPIARRASPQAVETVT
jgi:acyl transferase domain-containing protein/NAD(P)H-dependent flavin oxidoreductase YrpB (nitropropane dioxygenase family)